MLTPQVRLPSGSLADAFGLAFMLFDWDHVRVVGHDGATTGQNAYLRIVPGRGTAVALLTNGGFPAELFHALFGEIFTRVARHPAHAAPQRSRSARRFARSVLRRVREAVAAHYGARRHDQLIATVEGNRYPAPPQTYRLRSAAQDTFVGTLPGHRRPRCSTI